MVRIIYLVTILTTSSNGIIWKNQSEYLATTRTRPLIFWSHSAFNYLRIDWTKTE